MAEIKKYTDKDIISIAKKVFEIEEHALKTTGAAFDGNFVKAVRTIAACKGRLVLIGIGKSGHIGRKIAATLASTGTPSFFVHPTEALHGDLGMITKEDLVLALSFSGQTEEISKILLPLKKEKVKIISMTGNPKSNLAMMSDLHIHVVVEREACPYNLAPTASTTAMLACGDALAIALMKIKHFEKKDFAMFHPGGSLGKLLTYTVKDIMFTDKNPIVPLTASVQDTLLVMTKNKSGAASVVVGLCITALSRLGVNFFFKTIAAAAVLGAVIYGLRAMGLPMNTDVAVISALMVLVPGLVFTNFMCDLLTGDTVSGVSTFVRAVLTAAAIAVGTGTALWAFQTLGFDPGGTGTAVYYGPAAQCLTAFLACIGFSVMYNVHGWGVVLCCLGGAAGWAVYLAAGLATQSIYLRYLAAGIAIAVYAEVMARVRKYPITAYLVVSFFPLVPGSYIYYAMYYAIQGQRQRFLESGIQALGLASCLAIGTLLVSTTVRTYVMWRRERGKAHGSL